VRTVQGGKTIERRRESVRLVRGKLCRSSDLQDVIGDFAPALMLTARYLGKLPEVRASLLTTGKMFLLEAALVIILANSRKSLAASSRLGSGSEATSRRVRRLGTL